MLSDEKWDVYDIHGVFLNKTIQKRGDLAPGEYHLYVDVWVMNPEGDILLTLRAPGKDTAPSKWENTGGAVVSGERSVTAAARELFEETGIRAGEEQLIKIGEHVYGNTISHIFLFLYNSEEKYIRLSPRETVDYKWVPFSVVKQMVEDNMMVPDITGKFMAVADKLDEYTKRRKGNNG